MIQYEIEALEYISKLSNGQMRDAITLMDKCLAYSTELTLENVVKALGVLNYDEMFRLLDCIIQHNAGETVKFVENVHRSGRDLKQFIKQFTNFVLDVCKYLISGSFDYISIPELYENDLEFYRGVLMSPILEMLVKLNAEIKWDESPKAMIEATFMLECVK